jgi:diguanylate cyclase (GGDEF)-like protein
MTEYLKQAITQARWRQRAVALLVLDLDGFKVINDTLGHESGDQMICEMARRLLNATRAGETVARLGGDEFGILITDIGAAEDARPIAERLLALVAQPMCVDGQQLFVTGSIGICCYPHSGDDAKVLLRNADIAMYRAKSNGRNQFQYFSADMTAKAFERLRLENSLRQALAKNQYCLHYQPQVDTASGRVCGLEALLRWSSPDLGIVPPDQFIPVLEDTGLIIAVGQWVIRTACKELRRLLDAGLNVPSMSINLSARQLFDTQLVAVISATMAEQGLDPSFITMEITESILMENHQSSAALLRELREMGIHIALDDFGTGFSSLGYLRRFPIDIVKIDRSFVGDIPHRKESSSIVSAIISMAHDLDIEVIAEGVENREQLDFLRSRRCEKFQGFLFSRPTHGEQLERILEINSDFGSQDSSLQTATH